MSNYYDLETDLDVEDVTTEGEYEEGYEEYEGEEDQRYGSYEENGNYNPEAAEEKWGDMAFDRLVVELEDVVSRSKRYFFSKTKKVVNGEDLIHLSQYMQDKLPSVIVESKDIVTRKVEIINEAENQKNEILAEAHRNETETVARAKEYYSTTIKRAKDEAEAIIDHAEARAVEMVQQTEIYKRAAEEAEKIIQLANQKADGIVSNAETAANQLAEDARNYAIRMTESARTFITNHLYAYQQVAATNLDKINSVNGQLQTDYQEQMVAFGLVRGDAAPAQQTEEQ